MTPVRLFLPKAVAVISVISIAFIWTAMGIVSPDPPQQVPKTLWEQHIEDRVAEADTQHGEIVSKLGEIEVELKLLNKDMGDMKAANLLTSARLDTVWRVMWGVGFMVMTLLGHSIYKAIFGKKPES